MSGLLVDNLYETLRGDIRTGRWRPGSRLPPESALASEFRTSRTTLRHALRRLEDGGLVASRQGSGRTVVSSGGSVAEATGMMAKTIALVTNMSGPPSDFGRGPLESAIDAGVYDACRQRGLHLLNLNVPIEGISDDEVSMLLHNPPRGLVITHPELAGSSIVDRMRRVKNAGVALVVHGNSDDFSPFDRVVSDHAHGSAQLTRWLLEQGCRRILRVWGIESPRYWLSMRDEGHERAMRDAGLEPLPALVVRGAVVCTDDPVTFQTRVRQFAGFLIEHLRGPTPVDAIVATNDPDAIITAAACKLLGIDPVRDIRIVGYDSNFAVTKEYRSEPFTPAATINKVNENTGQLLVQTLMSRLAGELPPEPVRAMTIPTLVVNVPGQLMSS